MKGPAPLPRALKIIKGVRPYRINQNEPKPQIVNGDLPTAWAKIMTADARAFWKQYAPLLSRLGVLTEADLPALRITCELQAKWLRITAKLNGKKKLSSKIELAYLRMANQIETQKLRYLQQFGMTPSSRGKIETLGANEEENEDLD